MENESMENNTVENVNPETETTPVVEVSSSNELEMLENIHTDLGVITSFLVLFTLIIILVFGYKFFDMMYKSKPVYKPVMTFAQFKTYKDNKQNIVHMGYNHKCIYLEALRNEQEENVREEAKEEGIAIGLRKGIAFVQNILHSA